MPGSVHSVQSSRSYRQQILPNRERQQSTGRLEADKNSRARQHLPPSPADTEEPESVRIPSESDQSGMEETRLTRNIDRGAPGDSAIFSENKTPEQKELAKRKSQYYGDVFAQREPNSNARDRIGRESVVMADVRTNVIVHDEYTFITDLSYNLSNRYQRPESSILVTVNHSACLLFGGSFEPAYTMTITALPSQVQPVTNKRNAALLQRGMEEALGVPPSRGLVKFIAIAEENLATNGRTMLSEIEELEKETAEDNVNLKRSLSRSASSTRQRQSMKSLRNGKAGNQHLSAHNERLTPPTSDRDTPPLPPIPTEKSAMDMKATKAQKMGRRKSFMAAVFGK